MADFYYTTVAYVRAMDDAFALDVVGGEVEDEADSPYPDETVQDWIEKFSHPPINRKLRAAGFSVPFTTDDESIQEIAACLVVAAAYSGMIAQFAGRDPERAKTLREYAADELNKIATGETEISHSRSDSGDPILVSTTPETRHAEQMIAGDAEDWTELTETRSS